MPIARTTLKIVISGTISGVQSWSTGLWWTPNDDANVMSNEDIAENLTALEPAISDWAGSAFVHVNSPDTTVATLTGYGYDRNTTDRASTGATVAIPVVAGTGNSPAPSFTSMVQSLHTATLGRRYRGRMYLPATGAGLGADHRFQTADVTAAANATARLITAINATVHYSIPLEPDVVGQVVIRSVTGGVLTPVTGVSVDNLPDTQHRREDKLGATHVSRQAIPYTG